MTVKQVNRIMVYNNLSSKTYDIGFHSVKVRIFSIKEVLHGYKDDLIYHLSLCRDYNIILTCLNNILICLNSEWHPSGRRRRRQKR